jgi:hypothetical protein
MAFQKNYSPVWRRQMHDLVQEIKEVVDDKRKNQKTLNSQRIEALKEIMSDN